MYVYCSLTKGAEIISYLVLMKVFISFYELHVVFCHCSLQKLHEEMKFNR